MERQADVSLQERMKKVADRGGFFRKWGIPSETVAKILSQANEFVEGKIPASEVRWIEECIKSYQREYRARPLSKGDNDAISTLAIAHRDLGVGIGTDSVNVNDLMVSAARQYCTKLQAERLEHHLQTGLVSSSDMAKRHGVSRCRIHESIGKARSKALAGLILQACECCDASVYDAVLSRAFAVHSPFNADVMRAFECLLLQKTDAEKRQLWPGLLSLWSRCERCIQDVISQSAADVAVSQPATLVLFLGARFFGDGLKEVFQDTWKTLSRHGLKDSSHFLRHLSVVGAYCGVEQHLIDFVETVPNAECIEMAGTTIFAAGELRSRLPIGELILGRPEEILVLLRGRTSGFGPLLDYAIGAINCERYNNEALVGMVLRWVINLCQEVRNRSAELPKTRLAALRHSLRQYQRRLVVSRRTRSLFEKAVDLLPEQ